MALLDHVHRFSNADYKRMVDAGLFDDDRNIEFLDGLFVEMSQQSPEHAFVVQRVTQLLASRPELLRVQMPLEAAEGWIPEPDVALAESDPSRKRHPATALIAVEVSLSSQSIDRRKAAVYAAAGIPRYWLVDLPRDRVLEYAEPGAAGYGVVTILTGDDVLDAHVEGVAATTVAELLAR
jgi:Uma2 family endonuclease